MSDNRKIALSTVLRLLAVLSVLVLLLAMGWWVGNQRVSSLDASMREHLLREAVAIADTLNPDLIRQLTFTAADKGTPAFEIIREHLLSVSKTFPQRGISSEALRGGKLFFGPETYSENDPIGSPPGTEYLRPPAADLQIFKDGRPVTVGPYTDEYGTFISSLAPVLDPDNGEVVMAVSVDILADDWQTKLNAARITPLFVALALILLLSCVAIVIRWYNRREKQDMWKFRKWIIAPVALAMLGGLLLYGIFEYWEMEEEFQQNVFRSTEQIRIAYNQAVAANVTLLRAQMDYVTRDPMLLKAWKDRDLVALTALTQPEFEQLKRKYGITHYYLIAPDRVCFFRVHQPDLHGDLIDRQTLLVAEKTGEDAWGFELGSLGSFTLRYVRPWKQDGIVIGYLELGVEIDNIGTHLANEMNLDILTFIRKDCTTRENFEVGRQIFGFPGQWDAYPDLVMLHQTTPVLPEDLSSWLENSHSQTTELDMANIRLGKRRFACGVIPLFDVAGRNVAKLISLRNVTTEVAETRNSLISVLGLAALLFGGILSLVWSIASAAEKKLGTAVKELQESEVRFKQLAEQNRTIVWEVDTQGLYLYVSQVSKSILGYRPDELVGKMHFYDLHPESGREEFKKAAFAIFAKKEPFQNLKNASQPKDGRQILLSTNGFPLLKVDGTLRGYRGSDTDITERGKAEEALFKSEKKYRSLIEMTHTGFLILDGQGRVLDANAEYVRLSGHHGLGEILGRCVIEWTAAHSREKNNLAVARCVRDGIIQGLELDYKGPDGRITPIEINATVEGTGNDVRIMSLCRDISERKRMEEALVFSNIILRTQQEASIDGILVVSEKDKILSFNQRFVDMWGIPPGIMESKFDAPVLQAVMDKVASPEEFVRRVAHLYKSRNEISMDEIVLKDGRTFDRYSGPMVGAEERYYGRVWYFRDITGRKKAEEELRALNRQIEFILGTTKTGLDIIDSDFNLTYVDPEWQKQYGDYAGKKCYKYFMGKNEPCPNCGATKALEEKKPVVSEEILPAEGNRCIQVTSIPFQDESGNWLVAEVNVDITGRKKTEAAQKEMEGQLHQSQKMAAIGQLAGGIAHDFNNQLAGIVGYADMLYNSLDDAKLKSKAERIIRSSEISAELIKKLMAFSCKGKYLSAPVNVHKVIEEICSLLSHTFDRRIKIKKVLNAKTAMISGDSSQIQNAFLNLALNARDAMPNGGETIFTTEDVDMEDVFAGAEERQKAVKGHWLKICVIDGGTGMDDNVKTHLFEPFFTTKPQGKGTGMGLASVYGTVKHHNGIINVKSTIGEGTEFSMFFPILNVENVKGDENEVGSDLENSVPISAVPRKKSKILLVDDEEMLRSMVSEILTSTGYEVITCNDGLEAVELYRREWKDIDLVLLDMMMPEMNGKDAFMEMRSINGNIKALLISGYSIEGEAQILIDAGMKGFIPKPFNPQVLLKKVGDALGVTRNQ